MGLLPDEPLSFRFVVQPLLAILLGLRDGRRDASAKKPPWFLSMLTGRHQRWEIARTGLETVAVPLAIAIVIDGLVQVLLSQRLRVLHAVVVGVLLIGVPYILSRGLTNRSIVRRAHARERRRA